MSEKLKTQPVVSVGIPTYNRPKGLRRTLESITRQTYKNLEIIISDNCSPDSETEIVAREYVLKDPRIRYFRQEKNEGPNYNFKFVLEKASGEFFMWAADDDEWDNYFIEDCLNALTKAGTDYVAAITEAQYFYDNPKFQFDSTLLLPGQRQTQVLGLDEVAASGEASSINACEKYDFFSEGRPLYDFYSSNTIARLLYILKYNYGNLYYSLFRKSALYDGQKSIFECINVQSLNEIFLFLFVMERGNWLVIPKVGFYKNITKATYEQAKWEKVGGRLPNSKGIGYFRSLPGILKYHLLAKHDIFSAIDNLRISSGQKLKLKLTSIYILAKHYCAFVIRYKKRAF